MNLNRLHKEFVNMPISNFPIWPFYFKKEEPGILFVTHWHEHLEIFTITKGSLIVDCENNQIEAHAGDTVIINPNEYHSCSVCSDDLELYCVIIDPILLHGQQIDACVEKYILPIINNQVFFSNIIYQDIKLIQLAKDIVENFSKQETAFELKIKALVFSYFAYLYKYHYPIILNEKTLSLRNVNHQRVQQVLDYIEKNYKYNIRINDIAHFMFINKFYLCKIFKEFTGMSIVNYINLHRINKASYLLMNTDKTVTEVAITTGFNEINYFSRIYKKYTGISPNMVKKNAKVRF